MYITYNAQGRTCNNIFQYFSTKVIQKLINDSYRLKHPSGLGPENQKDNICKFIDVNDSNRQTLLATNRWLRIDDNFFINFYNSLKHNLFNNFNANFYIDGFFQLDCFINSHLDFIKSLICETNKDSINAKYNINQLYTAFKDYSPEFTDNDLVVHLRLDDFINEGHNSYVLKPECYIQSIKRVQDIHKFKTIYIVVDKIRRVWEKEYIDKLLRDLSIYNISILETADLFTDMARLYSAKNVFCSNSTFCWIPVLLGRCEKNWLPEKNTCDNQKFFKINEYTQKYPVEYLYMSKAESVELI